jgi:hypothetical protein
MLQAACARVVSLDLMEASGYASGVMPESFAAASVAKPEPARPAASNSWRRVAMLVTAPMLADNEHFGSAAFFRPPAAETPA